ncbi:hypothetical protein Tco_1337583 [Tanacetum coccineum]
MSITRHEILRCVDGDHGGVVCERDEGMVRPRLSTGSYNPYRCNVIVEGEGSVGRLRHVMVCGSAVTDGTRCITVIMGNNNIIRILTGTVISEEWFGSYTQRKRDLGDFCRAIGVGDRDRNSGMRDESFSFKFDRGTYCTLQWYHCGIDGIRAASVQVEEEDRESK